jgi:hypothetical protein
MKSFKKYVAEDKSLERALASDAAKPKKKPTLPKAPWDKKDEAMSPETKAKEAKRAGVGRSGETFRDRQKRLGKPQTEAKDTHCSDDCCGSDVKAEDCNCPPDCAHCDCNAEVNETFDPKHPKVVAARKAHKAGNWNGNVDKNGNAIVHINGKPHTVTSGDPAARNEETEQLDELSPATLKSYKKKAMKQYKQSANKRMPGGGDYGSATKKAQDKHQKRFDKRHKGIGSEIKRTTDSDIHLKDPKGLVRKNPKANSLSGKPAPYKYKAESLSEEQVNQITAQYINENNISMAELEAMSPEQLDEFIGKAVGGAFKLGAKAAVGTARLAGKGIKKAANRMSTAGRADAAEKKAKSIEQKQKDRERMQAAKQRVRDLKQKQAEAKRKQNQQQNKPKPA